MATKYEYFSSGDDAGTAFFSPYFKGQTFTPSTAHKITSVKLKLYRIGSPGTITVSIRATSDGKPTGPALCSGTTNGNTLTTNTAGEWREITLGDGYDLSASTMYAICVDMVDGDSSNTGRWRGDYTSPTYAGGSMVYTSDGGTNWRVNDAWDMMFEEWGEAIAAVGRSFGFIFG